MLLTLILTVLGNMCTRACIILKGKVCYEHNLFNGALNISCLNVEGLGRFPLSRQMRARAVFGSRCAGLVGSTSRFTHEPKVGETSRVVRKNKADLPSGCSGGVRCPAFVRTLRHSPTTAIMIRFC